MSTAHEKMDLILRKMGSLDGATWALARQIQRMADRIKPGEGENIRLGSAAFNDWVDPKNRSDIVMIMNKMDNRLRNIEFMANKTESLLNEVANQNFLAEDLRIWIDGGSR